MIKRSLHQSPDHSVPSAKATCKQGINLYTEKKSLRPCGDGGILLGAGPPKTERTNTIARPGLKVYAAPGRIPPSPHRRSDFFSVYKFIPCLQIAFALGTEWSGD